MANTLSEWDTNSVLLSQTHLPTVEKAGPSAARERADPVPVILTITAGCRLTRTIREEGFSQEFCALLLCQIRAFKLVKGDFLACLDPCGELLGAPLELAALLPLPTLSIALTLT